MHFLKLDKLLPIETAKDLYIFWLTALAFRKNSRHLEKKLANYVFLASNQARKNVVFDDVLDDITFEFNQLETLGDSDIGTFDRSDEANKQWRRLETIVNTEYLKFIEQQ
jgi:hypothetical protein